MCIEVGVHKCHSTNNNSSIECAPVKSIVLCVAAALSVSRAVRHIRNASRTCQSMFCLMATQPYRVWHYITNIVCLQHQKTVGLVGTDGRFFMDTCMHNVHRPVQSTCMHHIYISYLEPIAGHPYIVIGMCRVICAKFLL